MKTLCLTWMTLVAGCGIASFDVTQELPEQTIAGSPNPLAQLFPSLFALSLVIDLREETAAHDTGPAQSAYLSSLTLDITPHAMPSGSFDFLDSVHVSVSAPGLPTVEIASVDPVPRGATTLSFTVVANVNLLPYINAGATITSSASGRQPMMDVRFDGVVVITIHV